MKLFPLLWLLLVTSGNCTLFFNSISDNIINSGTDGGVDKIEDDCFCQLEGKIDECTCNIDTVDYFNNVKIYPRLKSLLQKDYFRFYNVNLKRKCPFWSDDSKCAMRYCHVEQCPENEIPAGLKGSQKYLKQSDEDYNSIFDPSNGKQVTRMADFGDDVDLGEEFTYVDQLIDSYGDCNSKLDYLNKTLSNKVKKDIKLWTAHDNALDSNFCDINDNDEDAEYVDLLLNPERYTGYRGRSAHRIWQSIYLENCFGSKRLRSVNDNYDLIMTNTKLNELCLEERVFYRAISGLHASINIHLSAEYLFSNNLVPSWAPNLAEFKRRFSPETTNGEGPNWLRNLYFVYLLELRALYKAADVLENTIYYTGNEAEDWDTQMAMRDLLNVIRSFPDHYDESTMFNDNHIGAVKLKNEFRQHFRNVTRIMDCVGCDKCKLWGKLQTHGLGTALKILFGEDGRGRGGIELQRNEIVALVNAIGRLSTSIYKLDDFRRMLREGIGRAHV